MDLPTNKLALAKDAEIQQLSNDYFRLFASAKSLTCFSSF